jgi:hypothetical protein
MFRWLSCFNRADPDANRPLTEEEARLLASKPTESFMTIESPVGEVAVHGATNRFWSGMGSLRIGKDGIIAAELHQPIKVSTSQ